MTRHSHFERLSALEASGQLDPCEHLELLSHCESCESCRAALIDMQSVTSQILAIRQAAVRGTIPVAMRERFVAKARQQGIHVSGSRRESLFLSNPILAAVAAVFLLGVGCFLSKSTTPSHRPRIEQAQAATVAAQKTSEVTPVEHALSLRHSIDKNQRVVGRKKLHQEPFTSLAPSQIGRSWPALTSSRFALTGMLDLDRRTCCSYPTLIDISRTQTWAHFPPTIQKTPSDLTAGRMFRYEATLAPMPSMFHGDTILHGFTLTLGITSPRFVPVAALEPKTDGEEQ